MIFIPSRTLRRHIRRIWTIHGETKRPCDLDMLSKLTKNIHLGIYRIKFGQITMASLPYQAQVVQRTDKAIHYTNHYPVDSMVCFVNTYPATE